MENLNGSMSPNDIPPAFGSLHFYLKSYDTNSELVFTEIEARACIDSDFSFSEGEEND